MREGVTEEEEGGGINREGSQTFQIKKRSSHHEIHTSLLKTILANRIPRDWSGGNLMPVGRYLFIPFFEDEKSDGQTKISQPKNLHKDQRTNIIATNFIWEQLITNNLQNAIKIAGKIFFQSKINF